MKSTALTKQAQVVVPKIATGRKRPLSADEFARACARARMEPSSLAIARAVLVDAQRQTDVASKAGVSRAWVSEAVAKFMRCVEETEQLFLPDGWTTDTVSLPSDMWAQVRKLEREARTRLRDQTPL